MSSLAFSVQRGTMASSSIRLGRGAARTVPLSIHRLASRHLVAASSCGMAAPNAGSLATNQRRSLFGLSKSSEPEEPKQSGGKDTRLRHIHIPYLPYPPEGQPSSIWTYEQVDALQEHLRRRVLDHKAAADATQEDEPSPIVITFTPHPVFTFGLRQHEEAAKRHDDLSKPLRLLVANNADKDGKRPVFTPFVTPAVVTSPRGGLVTYHGPGQLVCWPILDLRSKNLQPESAEHSPLGVRTWASMLEGISAGLFRERYGIDAETEPENPGVWTRGLVEKEEDAESLIKRPEADEPRKLAALGVHLRRFVTSLGVALNLSNPKRPCTTIYWEHKIRYSGREAGIMNRLPWSRIEACGIPYRAASSVVVEYGIHPSTPPFSSEFLTAVPGSLVEVAEVEAAADQWVASLASALGLQGGVEKCTPQDVGFTPTPLDEAIAAEYSSRGDNVKAKPKKKIAGGKKKADKAEKKVEEAQKAPEAED